MIKLRPVSESSRAFSLTQLPHKKSVKKKEGGEREATKPPVREARVGHDPLTLDVNTRL
jgi:hypothetical protein